MSDHKAEAENSLGCAGDIPFGDGDFDRRERYYLAAAQVHATLYAAEQTAALVEQHRIANILTVAQFDHATEDGGRLFTDMEGARKWRQQAAEQLGLS